MAMQARDLRRVYRSQHNNPDVVALAGVSMEIGEGETHGLLGPKGAASVSLMGDGEYRVELADESAASRVLELLVGAGVTSIRTSRPSLEEVYIRIIGDH